MTTSFYLYALLILALSLALSFFGSRWIETLYEKNRDILTFPDDVKRRGRWRLYGLGILFFACGIRFLFLTSGLPLFFLLFMTALLLLMTATDFEQYCLFDSMMIPLALGGMALTAVYPSLFTDHALAAAGGGAVFLLLGILSRGALGGGDIKLMACLGLWLGTDALIFVAAAGSIFGGLSALVLLLLGKKKRKSAFAYGPYFTLTTLALLLIRGL